MQYPSTQFAEQNEHAIETVNFERTVKLVQAEFLDHHYDFDEMRERFDIHAENCLQVARIEATDYNVQCMLTCVFEYAIARFNVVADDVQRLSVS